MSTQRLTIRSPDDWHLHLRDGDMLRAVLAHSAARFRRAVIMPNLRPPVTTTAQALAYRERIHAVLPAHARFEPLMTLYLTETTEPREIDAARASGQVHAVKLYPAGATTNSAAGVRDLARVDAVLERMQALDMPLLVHGEVTDRGVDVFDREAVFIERVLAPLRARYPRLRVVLEHVTTSEAIDYVRGSPPGIAATITAHHLLLDRNALFDGGLRPHHYCLPVLKRARHRHALLEAATSGSRRFFLGTDSAPHPRDCKESACGCAGVYTAHAGIELYAEAFEQAGRLDRLEGFASLHGPAFYGLPANESTLVLERVATPVPLSFAAGTATLVPLRAGGEVAWRVAP